jgi:glycosyltransferase involved in cell wall biosynthesis
VVTPACCIFVVEFCNFIKAPVLSNFSFIQHRHPLVTIVIPTYNRATLVQQAIASVIAQTYSHWELMIVDDGSDDGTSEAINAVNDSRIRILKMKHMGNIASLRNIGVKEGTGEWLAFLDSDDILIPRKLGIFKIVSPEIKVLMAFFNLLTNNIIYFLVVSDEMYPSFLKTSIIMLAMTSYPLSDGCRPS